MARGQQTADRYSVESALVFIGMNYFKAMNLSLIEFKTVVLGGKWGGFL